MNSNPLYFDDVDIFFLANRLTIGELRTELHWAEVGGFVAELFEDDDFDYQGYGAACREAIRWQLGRPKLKTQLPHKRIDLEVVKGKTDIVALIQRYTQLHKSGKNFAGRCPLHNDKSPSLFVYPDKQTWHCFGACNSGGDVIDFIMRAENTDLLNAATILGVGNGN